MSKTNFYNVKTWSVYSELFSFIGNELLIPMNRSGCGYGLNSNFWSSISCPKNNFVVTGLNALIDYADSSKFFLGTKEAEDAIVPGIRQTCADYRYLFIGTPSPAAPPWESRVVNSSRNRISFRNAALEMRELLEEVDLQLSESGNQCEDHMGIELQYLAILCRRLKEVGYKLDNKTNSHNEEIGRKCAKLLREASLFCKRHPMRWIDDFYEMINEHRPTSYYCALVLFTKGLLVECINEIEIQLSSINNLK